MKNTVTAALTAFAALVIVLATFAPAAWAASDPPRKFAVLIGVTTLKYTPSLSLKGPANDVARFRDLLTDRFAFAPADILTVQKQAATRAGMIRAIETQLIAQAQPGDLCVLYYSGHGTQVPDQPPMDEADGLDEALVPYDGNVTHGFRLDTHKKCDGVNCEGEKCDGGDPIPSTLLLDDDLNALLSRIKTTNIVVLLDACHSGTATRGGATDKRWVRAKAIDRPGPNGVATASDDLGGDLLGPTVLTAAAANQKAKDWPFLAEQRAATGAGTLPGANDNMGAFTFFLIEALQSGGSATYRQVMEHIAARLDAREFTQTPQLEGRGLDRAFLGVAPAAPRPPAGAGTLPPLRIPGATEARVVSQSGSTVQLRALAGRPLSQDSIFSGASVAVQVGNAAVSGSAEYSGNLVRGRASVPGQRLTETHRHLAPQPLRVAVTGQKDLANSLMAALRAASGDQRYRLVPATEARDCDLEVTRAGEQITVTPYRNQQPLTPILSGSVASALPALRTRLDNLAATTVLSRLENPSADFAVEIRVNGKESDEVAVNDTVIFTARASRDCYLYLVDIDPVGKITVLLPNRFTPTNKLTAGKLYNMPLPDVYRLRIEGPAGPEVVKAIATTSPLNLSILSGDTGEFKPLAGRASDTALTLIQQLRQAVNLSAPSVPAGVKTEGLMATAGWAAATAYLRVVSEKSK